MSSITKIAFEVQLYNTTNFYIGLSLAISSSIFIG